MRCDHNFIATQVNAIEIHLWEVNMGLSNSLVLSGNNPDSNVHGANMGPTWVLSAPDGPYIGPMNLAIREAITWGSVDLYHHMASLGQWVI